MSWNDPEKQNSLEDVDVEDFYDTEGYSSLKKKKKARFGLGEGFPGLPDGFRKWAGIGAALVAVMILVMVPGFKGFQHDPDRSAAIPANRCPSGPDRKP